MLQRHPPQKEPSGSRSEDEDQRENPQGTEKDCGQQEEISAENLPGMKRGCQAFLLCGREGGRHLVACSKLNQVKHQQQDSKFEKVG